MPAEMDPTVMAPLLAERVTNFVPPILTAASLAKMPLVTPAPELVIVTVPALALAVTLASTSITDGTVAEVDVVFSVTVVVAFTVPRLVMLFRAVRLTVTGVLFEPAAAPMVSILIKPLVAVRVTDLAAPISALVAEIMPPRPATVTAMAPVGEVAAELVSRLPSTAITEAKVEDVVFSVIAVAA